jgi:outer membrane beta-barrel protein
MTRTLKILVLPALLLGLPSTALAQDGVSHIDDGVVQSEDEESSEEDVDFSDDDDDLNDILNSGEESVRQERDSLERGDIDDRIGVKSEAILAEEAAGEKRLIKTIQRKTFLKLGRFEGTPFVGFVTNDPFINRYIVGGGLTYHATEIFAVEVNLGYSPDLGEGDWKPLTDQLVNYNKVSPDISKLTLFTNAGFQFSPIYGKVAISGQNIVNFDIFGAFGMGTTQTRDDLTALGDDSEPAKKTEIQWHPTTNIGGGARVVFNENLAVRVEGRSMVYIETIKSTTLEMKNNFLLLASVSFFFPNM